MTAETMAVLLYDQPDPLSALVPALQGQNIEVQHARNCKEASRLLAGPTPPQLVFTDTRLPDGNWGDIVRLAEKARFPVNVIVVSRLVDVPLYVEAIERGAFDFIAPPFQSSDLAHVIRCALSNVQRRRDRRQEAEQTSQKVLALPALQAFS